MYAGEKNIRNTIVTFYPVVTALWVAELTDSDKIMELLFQKEIITVYDNKDRAIQYDPVPVDSTYERKLPQAEARDENAYAVIQEDQKLNTAEFCQADAQTIEREFKWDYAGKQWTYRLQVPQGVYNYYSGRERLPIINYGVFAIYITDPGHKEFISAIANSFSDIAAQEAYSLKQTVEFVLAFVQSIKYMTDEDSKGLLQYTRYPLETLVDLEGDCKDKSVLYASILKEMGLGVVLVILPGELGHMAVGVKGEDLPGTYYEYEGARYYYVETTARGWQIGQIPPDYKDREAKIISIQSQPLLLHEWEAKSTTGRQMELVVTVDNYGSTVARETRVYAFLDAGNDKAYSQQWSEPLNLHPGARGVYTHYLRVPAGVETRIVVNIISEGYLIDKSYSNWF